MKKNIRNGIALSLLAVCVASVSAGCGAKEGAGVYTYRDYLEASPETWNPHTWSTNTDQVLMGYTTMGFYDFIMNDTKDGYKIVPEMASGDPTTTALTDAEKLKYYGADTDEAKAALTGTGYKWTIPLNEKAVWDNGAGSITADDYIDSMELCISPEYKNTRASSWTSGTAALTNAADYNKNGEAIYSSPDPEEGKTSVDQKFYFNIYENLPQFGYSYNLAGLYNDYIADATLCPTIVAAIADEATWGNSQVSKYVEVTADNAATVVAMINEVSILFGSWPTITTDLTLSSGFAGTTVADWCFIKTGTYSTEWDNVGIRKDSDYQITLFLVSPITKNFDFYYNIGASSWLVNKDVYEKGTTKVGTLKKTTYATTLDNYVGFGPYKLTEYQLDKSIKLVKNTSWYGWTDGQHKDQFQTTNIDIQIIKDENSALLSFEKGDIDSIGLRSEDMKKYSNSSKLIYTPQDYTTKMSLNSSWSALKGRQTTGKNKTILTNRNFREALSWSINRTTLAQTQTSGSEGYLVPINDMYIADSDTGKRYRDTDEGKKVITDVFGTNTSGYDHDKVIELVNKAVDEESASTKDGHYATGDVVSLEWGVYNTGWTTMVDWIIDQLKTAMVGTKLEGKFDITTTYDESYSDKMKAGNYDICMSTWGGATFDPFGIPEVYCDTSYAYEYGFNSQDESTAFSIEGIDNGTAHTFYDWWKMMTEGDYSASKGSTADRIKILAAWEENYVKTFVVISLYARRSVAIESFKIKEGTEDYNILYGYGGIRFMTYNYDDAAWADRVAKGLDYTI